MEVVAQLEEQLELEQWPKIEFRFESVPGSPAKLNSTGGSSSEFLLACDRIKNVYKQLRMMAYYSISSPARRCSHLHRNRFAC